jgi:Helix-turn-helix domain
MLVADLIEEGRLEFQPEWMAESKRTQIEAACVAHGIDRLRAIKDALPGDITFDEIRLVVARLRRQKEAALQPAG